MRLYLPSTVVGSGTGITGDGGYEGQYSLDGNKPMIVEMTLYGHTNNPVAYEGNHVDSFADINGGICSEHAKDNTDKTEKSYRRMLTRGEVGDKEEEEIDPARWSFRRQVAPSGRHAWRSSMSITPIRRPRIRSTSTP